MKRLFILPAILLAACAPRATVLEPPQQPPVAPDANFVLIVEEAVAAPEEDHLAYVVITVDGAMTGKTAPLPRSRRKEWGLTLEPGNRLFRFDLWHLDPAGDWKPLDSQWQPPQRFYRVEPGKRTIVSLRFTEGSRKHDALVRRETLAP